MPSRCIDALARAEANATDSSAVLEYLAHGVFIMDAQGAVTRVNRAGTAILQAFDGLTVERRELRCRSTKDTSALRALIQSALRTAHDGSGGGGVLMVERPSGCPPLRIVVAPLPRANVVFGTDAPGAVVFVTDPERLLLDSDASLKSARRHVAQCRYPPLSFQR